LKLDRHQQQHGVHAAKKLNVIQPVSPPPEGGSHTFDRDGHDLGLLAVPV
jgi:hypothetical protein